MESPGFLLRGPMLLIVAQIVINEHRVMKKRTVVVLAICVLALPNLPFINKYIAVQIDGDYYRYSNRDGFYTYLQDMSFKSPGFSTRGLERFSEQTSPPREDRTLYRLYHINPLCFWRWHKYVVEGRHFDYMDWEEIEKRRDLANKGNTKLSKWQDF